MRIPENEAVVDSRFRPRTQLEDLDGVRRVVEQHRRSRLVYQVLEAAQVAHARQVADGRRDPVASNSDRLFVRHLHTVPAIRASSQSRRDRPNLLFRVRS